MKAYEFFEHTADIGVRAYGRTLEELFINAASALYEIQGRFDLADQSYAKAVRLAGQRASILNNEGYSYMLRGDLRKARAKFDAALRIDPGNATAINNLVLLNQSAKYVERAADGEPCGSVPCGN